ncbi:MAG: 2-oxoacid:acceptor oxidoreductase subunit alpha, partial [Euryarchaeota archaeon]|nr:2-oxoacid:acceptor oxidoreductase subunit alpha [Euryarchaeota archaeon]
MSYFTVRIGGAAGDGIASAGETLARTCSRSGLHVLAYNAYQSVIRGGHVWFQVRASREPVTSTGDILDLLIALNRETVTYWAPMVRPGGGIIHDPASLALGPLLPEGVQDFPLDLGRMALQFSEDSIMKNTVALGAALHLCRLPRETFETMMAETFQRKGEEVVQANLGAARAGYDHAASRFAPLVAEAPPGAPRRPLLTGNQAIGLGALAAGCKFYVAYPMTPATTVLHYLAVHGPEHGMVVKQAEDEIAVINMAIGAGFAGARSMCGTSGGGFALMTEAVGLASMTETPVVIFTSQRAGPSTGLPTKTEQGDLPQVLGASQGDYPRAVIAPVSVEDCFHATIEAFHIAEGYQMPVILVGDFYTSEHFETVEGFDLHVPIQRGLLVEGNGHGPQRPKRFQLTESGVSPRILPGTPDLMFTTNSDEHGEEGEDISDVFSGLPGYVELRARMMEKRMRKMDGVLHDLPPPRLHGPPDA